MTARQGKSETNAKTKSLFSKFIDISCFQNSSKVFSPILQILISLEVFFYPRDINPQIP